jgi:hypothetical protein
MTQDPDDVNLHEFKEIKDKERAQDWMLLGSKYKTIYTKAVIANTLPFNDLALFTCSKSHFIVSAMKTANK